MTATLAPGANGPPPTCQRLCTVVASAGVSIWVSSRRQSIRRLPGDIAVAGPRRLVAGSTVSSVTPLSMTRLEQVLSPGAALDHGAVDRGHGHRHGRLVGQVLRGVEGLLGGDRHSLDHRVEPGRHSPGGGILIDEAGPLQIGRLGERQQGQGHLDRSPGPDPKVNCSARS